MVAATSINCGGSAPTFGSHFQRRCAGESRSVKDRVRTSADLSSGRNRDTFADNPGRRCARRDRRAAREHMAYSAVAVVQPMVVIARSLRVYWRDVRTRPLRISIADSERALETDLQQGESEREDSESSRSPARTDTGCHHSRHHARRATRRSRAIPSDTVPASGRCSAEVGRTTRRQSPWRMASVNPTLLQSRMRPAEVRALPPMLSS